MLRIDCLFKNTDIADDVKKYIKYLGGFHAEFDGKAPFERIYKKMRAQGIEIDAKSAAMIYADVLPRDDERFTSNEDLESMTGQKMADTVRNLMLRERPKGEQQIGELSPAEAVVKNLTDAFTNTTVTDPKEKTMLRTMQDAYLQTAKKMLGELPDKPGTQKDTRPFEQVIQDALDKESLGYKDQATGEINGFKKLHEAAVAKMKEISSEVKNSNDPVLQQQWETYAKSFEDSAYQLMFSTKEGKKVLQDALMSKDGGGFAKESADGTKTLDWEKLAAYNNDFSKLRDNVIKAFKAKGFDEDTANKVADSLSKEFEDLRTNIVNKSEKLSPAKTSLAGLFEDGKLDPEKEKLQAALNNAKRQADMDIQRDEQKNLPQRVKNYNWFIKMQRAFKLSGVRVIGKLMNAGLTRLWSTPLEDVAGGVWSKAIPKLAKGAIGEGGLNVKETASGFTSGFMKGIDDIGAIMNTKEIINAFKNHEIKGLKDLNEVLGKSPGKSNLDLLFAKYGDLPPEALDFFGHLHSAIKAPVKRAAFERSLKIRTKNYIANGIDVTDPLVQTKLGNEAYQDANRAIFMQDNKVSNWYQGVVKDLQQEKTDKKTGEKYSHQGAATVVQFMLPFVKVGSNIIGEATSYNYGLAIGGAKLLKAAFTGGIENLPQEQKDMIMRNLKKGSLGAAAMLLGYFKSDNFGGFYQDPNDEKKKKQHGEPGAGAAEIFGTHVPKWFLEAPIFLAMQTGATIRRVSDKMVKGKPQGLTQGMLAASLGLVKQAPLLDQPIRVASLFAKAGERDYYFDELVKSTFIPAAISNIAEDTDPEERKSPKTLEEHLESGIPGLHEKLPLKHPKPVEDDIPHY